MKFYSILLICLVFLGRFQGTSTKDNLFGLDLFLWLSGLDSLPDCQYCDKQQEYNDEIPCELCDKWENHQPEKDTFSSTVAATMDNMGLSISIERLQSFLPEYDYCRFCFTLPVTCLGILLLLKMKRRKNLQRQRVRIGGMHTQRLQGKRPNAPKSSPVIQSQSKESDKLRKTKKLKKYHLSKQGQVIVKKMQHCAGDGGIYNVVTHESCKLISFKHQKQNGLRTFDMRHDIIPENVINALLCIKPNCVDHLHQSVRKHGNIIVCEANAFGLDSVNEQQMLPNKRDLNQDQEIENVYNNQDESNIDTESTELLLDDDEGYEIGPPRASSSFISDSSDLSLMCDENKTDRKVDPFSFLDEPDEPSFKRFLDNSFSWFGGLYNYTTDRTITSLNSFRVDNLNESISKGLCDLEKSFSSKEVQRNFSFYGNDTEPLFHFAFIYLAQQFIQLTKSTWDSWRKSTKQGCSDCSNEDCDCNNNQPRTEINSVRSGYAITRGTELDSQGLGYAIYSASEYHSH